MIVETESAIYALDLVSMRLKRMPRASPIVVENPREGLPAVGASLRLDGEVPGILDNASARPHRRSGLIPGWGFPAVGASPVGRPARSCRHERPEGSRAVGQENAKARDPLHKPRRWAHNEP